MNVNIGLAMFSLIVLTRWAVFTVAAILDTSETVSTAKVSVSFLILTIVLPMLYKNLRNYRTIVVASVVFEPIVDPLE